MIFTGSGSCCLCLPSALSCYNLLKHHSFSKTRACIRQYLLKPSIFFQAGKQCHGKDRASVSKKVKALEFRHKSRLRQHLSLVLEKRQVPIFSCQTNKTFGDERMRHFIKMLLFLFSTLTAWRRFFIFCLFSFFGYFCFVFSCYFYLESFIFS